MKSQEELDRRVATAFFGRFAQIRDLQLAAAKALLRGENLVMAAGTGSGKTEAVLAPLVSRFWRDAAKTSETFIVYVAPTKALVNDIKKRTRPPFATLGLNVSVRHGDRDDLVTGQPGQLLLTTPESLDVLLSRKDPALKSVRAVVLDEVHLLYNTQRGLQLSILLQRLRRTVPQDFQWAALSATIGELSHVRDFLFGTNAQATMLRFPATRAIDAQILPIANVNGVASMVGRLSSSAPTKLLLFTDSRKECERLTSALSDVSSLKDSIFAHYSSLSAELRVETEQRFASSRTAVCLATGTLELGIDIGDIDAVSLWGAPANIESFLQPKEFFPHGGRFSRCYAGPTFGAAP
ncbi:MAG: DEAD/DEAH box helicase [Planctomycetes bacterium]|nr:DEAD/DEAH box helicase [Planctomycetota bacterium]